ncbi:hypothetical protein F5880DRAFT_1489608, partial [Lentinula raphanica]
DAPKLRYDGGWGAWKGVGHMIEFPDGESGCFGLEASLTGVPSDCTHFSAGSVWKYTSFNKMLAPVMQTFAADEKRVRGCIVSLQSLLGFRFTSTSCSSIPSSSDTNRPSLCSLLRPSRTLLFPNVCRSECSSFASIVMSHDFRPRPCLGTFPLFADQLSEKNRATGLQVLLERR